MRRPTWANGLVSENVDQLVWRCPSATTCGGFVVLGRTALVVVGSSGDSFHVAASCPPEESENKDTVPSPTATAHAVAGGPGPAHCPGPNVRLGWRICYARVATFSVRTGSLQLGRTKWQV